MEAADERVDERVIVPRSTKAVIVDEIAERRCVCLMHKCTQGRYDLLPELVHCLVQYLMREDETSPRASVTGMSARGMRLLSYMPSLVSVEDDTAVATLLAPVDDTASRRPTAAEAPHAVGPPSPFPSAPLQMKTLCQICAAAGCGVARYHAPATALAVFAHLLRGVGALGKNSLVAQAAFVACFGDWGDIFVALCASYALNRWFT